MWLTRPGSVMGGLVYPNFNFGGDAPPSYNMPQINVPSASDLYNQGQSFYQQNYPGLINAQSTALNNANNPNYYSTFQPTSLENALGSQYFQNIWPDEQALIRQQFSQSGLASSPALAETEGRAYGNLGTQVGSYLSDQANQRATNSINAGLGISTSDLLGQFAQTGQQQSSEAINAQLAQANAQYQNSLAQYQYQQQQQQALGGAIGTGVGAIGGTMVGMPFQGAALGSQLGTMAGGGTANPYALTMSGLSMANGFNGFGGTSTGSGGMGDYSSNGTYTGSGQNGILNYGSSNPYSGAGQAQSVY